MTLLVIYASKWNHTHIEGIINEVFSCSREHVQTIDDKIDVIMNIRQIYFRLMAHEAFYLRGTSIPAR